VIHSLSFRETSLEILESKEARSPVLSKNLPGHIFVHYLQSHPQIRLSPSVLYAIIRNVSSPSRYNGRCPTLFSSAYSGRIYAYVGHRYWYNSTRANSRSQEQHHTNREAQVQREA
jgi:hypothetical protein